MQSILPASGNGGSTKGNPLEWVLRIGMIGGLIWGASKLINGFLPDIIEAIKNVWVFLGVGVPLAFVIGYILINPTFCWMWYTSLIRKITSFIIKMDPLSFMDRYADRIEMKLSSLRNDIITGLRGKKAAVQRMIEKAQKDGTDAGKLGQAAREGGNKNQIAYYGTLIANAKGTIETFGPLLENINKRLDMLEEIADNWDYSVKQLRATISLKREEYEVLNATYEGLSKADDWINSDNEAARVYAESLKALEEKVTGYMGYIENFENRSRGMLDSIRLEKAVHTNEGVKALEAFEADTTMFLPNDWNKTIDVPKGDYSVVTAKSGKSGKFGNLLKLD